MARRRWRRFWLLLVPATMSAGAILLGVAQGALAVSAAASGNAFKVSGDRLGGGGFTVVPGVYTEPGGTGRPVFVVTAREALAPEIWRWSRIPFQNRMVRLSSLASSVYGRSATMRVPSDPPRPPGRRSAAWPPLHAIAAQRPPAVEPSSP